MCNPPRTEGVVIAKEELKNLDVTAKRNEWYFNPPSFLDKELRKLVANERDLPILYTFFNITFVTIPAALLVFCFQSHTLGFIYYLANTLLFQERFILALHYSSHTGLFTSPTLEMYAPYFLTNFFGIPGGIYYLHHCVMHHVENNVFPWDLSSTEPYQRDNFFHFLHYWLRFMFAIWVELPYYAWTRGRKPMAVQAVTCECIYASVVYILYKLNPVATTWVFLVPLSVGSFLLMLGNWSQHIFVDPAKPKDNYHLTYNAINHEFNQRAFNDGYHIEHHAHSRRHWTELPANFMNNLQKYAAEDALVFEGVDFMMVGIMSFFGMYKSLSKKVVQLKKPAMPLEEVEKMLRARVVPIKRDEAGEQIKSKST